MSENLPEMHEIGRKVALVGRSVEQNVQTAMELGFLSDDNRVLIDKKEIKFLLLFRDIFWISHNC